MLDIVKGNIKRRIGIITVLKFVSWFLILIIMTIQVYLSLENKFMAYVTQGDIDGDSLSAYQSSILMIGIITGFLILVWWIVPLLSLVLEDFFGRNTTLCFGVMVLIHICITIVLQYKFQGIMRNDDDKSMIELWYVLNYPLLFVGGVLLFSPNNVCEVIVPCKKEIRYIVGWICISVSVVRCLLGGS